MPHLYDGLADYIMSLPGDLSQAVIDELCHGRRMDQVTAEINQQKIAAQQPEQTWVDGIGQHTMSITPEAYHYWGQRLGYQCWRSKEFRREYARDNPGARVRSVPRKTCVRINGFKEVI
jgi:hypothetical protein